MRRRNAPPKAGRQCRNSSSRVRHSSTRRTTTVLRCEFGSGNWDIHFSIISTMTHAITLSGGGAYGAFEIGVMKALMGGYAPLLRGEALDPTIFTGTSVGAYLSAVLLSTDAHDPQTRIAHLERIWLHEVAESTERGGNGAYYLRGDLRRY